MTDFAEKLPTIHLWVYNHPLRGISDQVEFFFLIMRQHGYSVSMSRRPRRDSLNVVIENFSEQTSGELIEFCERTGKRVALIMTEHLDLIGRRLFIHGEPLWSENDYMHPVTQVARIKNFMDCVPYFTTIFTLGDLPKLDGASTMLPGLGVRSLPFPKLDRVNVATHSPECDFVFTGALTAFREQLLQAVASSYLVSYTKEFLPRKRRDQLSSTGRVVLNLPQRSSWKWVSLMRIIAALRCGRATVSIGTRDTSAASRCCIQLEAEHFQHRIGNVRDGWRDAYEQAYNSYEIVRQEYLRSHGFPSGTFEYWAMFEQGISRVLAR